MDYEMRKQICLSVSQVPDKIRPALAVVVMKKEEGAASTDDDL